MADGGRGPGSEAYIMRRRKRAGGIQEGAMLG